MPNTINKSKYFSAIPSAIALLAIAVSQVNAAEEKAVALEEIVVTAERRAESIQDVPVSVTAFSSEVLERNQVVNVEDLQAYIPNIRIQKNTGTADGASVFLRGIGEDESRITADPAIAMYVDGVYVGRQVGAMFDLVDVERIEVLRGPQGTLYGRNANGGAIKLVSKKPSTENNSIKTKVTVGNEDRLDVHLSGNLAINDQFAVQAAVLDKSRDGFYRTSNGKEIGEVDSGAFRIAARYVTDNIDVLLAYDRTESDSDPAPATATREMEKAAGFDGDVFSIENALFSPPSFFGDPNPDTVYNNETDQDGVSLTINFDYGQYSISSLTAYRSMENELSTVVVNEYTQEVDQSQFSQEFQVSSNYDGNINWIAGLFYYTEDVDQKYFFFSTDYDMTVETDAIAVFGQINWELSEAIGVAFGGRYTTEDKDFEAVCFGSITPSGCLLTAINIIDTDESFSNTDFKLSVTYDITSSAMLFASYTTGFKSGGWSPDNFAKVDEETISTFEVGMKSDWLDNRLRINATYFFNDYEDLQIAGTTSLGFTRFNVDEVETSGFELELLALPLDNLQLSANIGYLDGDYVKVPADAIAAGTIPSESTALKNAPQWTATVGALYTLELGGNGELAFGVDVAYEEESYNLLANPEAVKRDDTALVNARINWQSENRQWQVTLWGKNLDDEVYFPAASVPYVYPGEPRTYGVDVSFRM